MKKFRVDTLFMLVLTMLIVGSVCVAATAALFIGSVDDIGSITDSFGTILLGQSNANIDINMAEDNVLMPGDNISVDFSMSNNGNASMYVRFQLNFTGTGVDAITNNYLPEFICESENSEEEWYYLMDFDNNETDDYHDYWYVKCNKLSKKCNENISLNFNIEETVGNEFQGTEVNVFLVIESVQSANNGRWGYAFDNDNNYDHTINWG